MPGFGPFVFCQASQPAQLTMEEDAATTEHQQTEVFIAMLEHQRTLWDPSDHSGKNRKKTQRLCFLANRPAKIWVQTAHSFARSIENINDRCDIRREAAHGQVDEAILRRASFQPVGLACWLSVALRPQKAY